MAQGLVGLAAMIPFVLLGRALERIWAPLLAADFILASAAFFMVQWPLWLAFGAQVVDRRGAAAALASSLRSARQAPGAGLVAVILAWLAFFVPLPMLIFYPPYFFFVFMPLAAIFSLVYYEASCGMLR